MRILIVAALGHAAIYSVTWMSHPLNIIPVCQLGNHLYGFAALAGALSSAISAPVPLPA